MNSMSVEWLPCVWVSPKFEDLIVVEVGMFDEEHEEDELGSLNRPVPHIVHTLYLSAES